MIIPSPKPTKFIFELKEVLTGLSEAINDEEVKQNIPRLHHHNEFNKRYSGVLDSYTDLEVTTERLTKNIQESLTTNSEIQRNPSTDLTIQKRAIQADKENKTDLKTIYVQTKIFLDRFNALILFILTWAPKDCDRSIGDFDKWIKDYKGADDAVVRYKESCGRALDDIFTYITVFRSNAVVHRDEDVALGKTEWFINDMNGSIRLLGGKHDSVSPQEVLFLAVEYADQAIRFCIDEIQTKRLNGILK